MASILIEKSKHRSLKHLLNHYEKLEDFQNLSLAFSNKKQVDDKLLKKYKIKIDSPVHIDLNRLNFLEFGKKHIFTDEENYIYQLDKKNISYPTYRYLEAMLRQAMMFTGNFEYMGERKVESLFQKNLPPERRISLLESHIESTGTQCAYGLGTILLDKFELIKRVEKEFEEQFSLIESIMSTCNENRKEILGTSSNFSLSKNINQIKDALIEWAKREIQVGDITLRKEFVDIDKRSKKFILNKKSFVYFSIYTVVAKSIFEPMLIHLSDKHTKTSGIFGFISSKLNYELNGQIEDTLDSKFSIDKFTNSKNVQEWSEIAFEKNLVDDDFFHYLKSLQERRKEFVLPFNYKLENNRLRNLQAQLDT